jgi:drug/metabolite transporter (DMT)-like permease
MHARSKGILLAAISAFGFGTLAIFGRLATEAGIDLPTLLAYRFLLATPMVWLPMLAQRRLSPLRGRNLAIGIGLGAVGYAAMSYLFLFGVNLTGAGLGALILYIYPALVVALAATVMDERITRLTVAAALLAVVGVGLVATGQPVRVDPLGVGVLLLAAGVYATYIVLSRHVLQTVSAPALSAHVIPAASVTFVAYTLLTGTFTIPATPYEWGIVVGVAALATAVPILTFFAAVSIVGASRTSVVSTFEPVFTVALGALVLGESLTLGSIVGGSAVLAGVLLIQLERAEPS